MNREMSLNFSEQVTFILPTMLEPVLMVVALIALIATIKLAYSRLIVNSLGDNKSVNSIRFSLVVMVNILAFITMMIMIADVKVQSENTAKYVLITQGTSLQQLSSISLTDEDHIYFLPQYIPQYMPKDSDKLDTNNSVDFAELRQSTALNTYQIDDIEQLMLLAPNLTKLTVLGDGLTKKQQSYLTDVNLSFTLSKPLLGPVNMNWNKQLYTGQTLTVQGVFQSSGANDEEIYKIVLDDIDAQSLATYRVRNNDSFELTSIPKTTGLFVYQLKVFDQSERLLLSEPVAFEVIEPQSPVIVVKQSSASFESRHIKNWAEQQGVKLLLLTQVSKNKQIQQRINFVEENSKISDVDNSESKELVTNLGSVTSLDTDYELLAHAWLRDFDLLFMDSRALLALSYNEQAELQKAVVDGLGLFIWADDDLTAAFEETVPQLLAQFQLIPTTTENNKQHKQYQTSVWWEQGDNRRKGARDRTELITPYKNINITAKQAMPLIYSENNKPLVINTSFGLGKVAISLINHSYQWSTSGQKSAYSQYWQHLMLNVARNRQQVSWHEEVENKISYLGESFQLCAHASNEDIFSDAIFLQQDFAKESTYCGIDWSTKLAWQRYSLYKNQDKNSANNTLNNTVTNKKVSAQQARYIYPQNSWLTWQQAQKHRASRHIKTANQGIELTKSLQTMNKEITWLIFFISLSLLWLEQKSYK